MRQYYAGEGSELPGRVNIGTALAHACVESNGAGIIKIEDGEDPVQRIHPNLPKAPILQPPASVKDVILRMLRPAVQRYWRTLEIRLPTIAGLNSEKSSTREIDRAHVADCMAQLPKFLQNEERVKRNEAFCRMDSKTAKNVHSWSCKRCFKK